MRAQDVVGGNIRRRRMAIGLSQEVLAERAELHRTYIGSVERGERNISLENICRIADALGCHPGELLDGLRPRSGGGRRGGPR